MSQDLMIRSDAELFMPIMTIDVAVERYNSIIKYVKELLRDGTDFGTIPGTPKATLLKPGAEKLCTLFGLSKRFALVKDVENWGSQGEPFFYYLYRCALYRGDVLIAEADGSCNSHETKYRWRKGERICPNCGKPTIIKGKAEYGGGWLCWNKPGRSDGCGEKYLDMDERIIGQNVERVPNPDVADQVNTIQKMAQKRALIAATLLAVNASEFFTQDIEDLVDIPERSEPLPAQPAQKRTASPKKTSSEGNAAEIELLYAAIKQAGKVLNELGDSVEWGLKTANAFANENFNIKGGVQELTIPQLTEMSKLLSTRIDDLKKPKPPKVSDLMVKVLSNFKNQEEFDLYLKEHDYPGPEKLSTAQLNAIVEDLTVPF